MLHTNLSTRPFYNVRAVRALLAGAAALVIAITLFNVVRIVRLSVTQRSLGAHADESEREATRLRTDAATVRAQINPKELGVVAAAAREANAIIDQRAFSWTALFTQFESTLPPDVRITSVQPKLDRDGIFRVEIIVQARRVEDLHTFLQALESSGGFHDVLPAQEETNDQGLIDAIIEGIYEPAPRTVAASEVRQ